MMLYKLKSELARNRYFGRIRNSAMEMPRGWKRTVFVWGGVMDVLWHHGLRLYDYQKEIEQIKDNGCMFSFTSYGKKIHMYLPGYQTDYLQQQIARYAQFWEIAVLDELRKHVIRPGDVILDIGANIGNHTVYFGRICAASSIHAFEPVKDTFSILARNVKCNGLDETACLHQTALGSSNGKAAIKYFNETEIGSAQLQASDDGDMEIRRLDDYAFERIDFIKIDVEKFEVELLKGAKETLTRLSPAIFIEIFEENFNEADRLLNEYGYYIDREFSLCNYLYRKRNSCREL